MIFFLSFLSMAPGFPRDNAKPHSRAIPLFSRIKPDLPATKRQPKHTFYCRQLPQQPAGPLGKRPRKRRHSHTSHFARSFPARRRAGRPPAAASPAAHSLLLRTKNSTWRPCGRFYRWPTPTSNSPIINLFAFSFNICSAYHRQRRKQNRDFAAWTAFPSSLTSCTNTFLSLRNCCRW